MLLYITGTDNRNLRNSSLSHFRHILGNTRTQRFDLAHIPGGQMAKIRKVYPPSLRPGEVPILRGQKQAKPMQNAKQLG